MRLVSHTMLALLASATTVHAQLAPASNEMSATGGYMRIEADDAQGRSSAWGGATFARRVGRSALAVSYEHFRRRYPNVTERFHAIGVAWRFQGGPSTTQPFLDVGWIVLWQEKSRLDDSYLFGGPGAAAGVTVLIQERLFVRPELRFKLLGPGPFMTLQPGATIGLRF